MYADKHKVLLGCEDVYEYEGKTNVNPKGYITYFSQAHSEYQQYLNENSRYATTEDKKIQEQIAQPVLEEILEDNLWYDRD